MRPAIRHPFVTTITRAAAMLAVLAGAATAQGRAVAGTYNTHR